MKKPLITIFTKKNNDSKGLPIIVDGRGPAVGPVVSFPIDMPANYLQRDSVLDGNDGRDSIFRKKSVQRFGWVPKKAVLAFLESVKYQIFILLLILYSLFAYNISVMVQAPPSASPYINAFLILCMSVFSVEIVLTIICNPRPPWFMLTLDMIATISIVVDLSWVAQAANFDQSNGSRMSQAAVVSARAGRIVRLVRLLRLLRTVSLLSKIAKKAMQRRKAADHGTGAGAPSNIGGKLTDALVIQMALVIIVTVIVTALLTSWSVIPSPFDVYVNAFGARVGATREELQPEVDQMLEFSRDYIPKQKPLLLRIGGIEWNWIEEMGGWPAGPNAIANFTHKAIDTDITTVELTINTAGQNSHDALLDTMLILTILILLLSYVLALNVTVYKTLVCPLERIYNIIRMNAAQIVAAVGNNGGEGFDNGDADVFSDEDGDIGTIEAAVQKMSRILAHASTAGREGTHVARTLAVGADNQTKEWLATMVGNDLNSDEQPSRLEKKQSVVPSSPKDALVPSGKMRPSMISDASQANGTAAAAAAAAVLQSSRSSGSSILSSCRGSRPNTGSFGALTGGAALEAAARLAVYTGDLSPQQREALLSVDLEELHSFNCDILSLPKEMLCPYLVTMFLQLRLIRSTNIESGQTTGFVEASLLWRFIEEVATFYHNVPYHNFYHCVDVTHSTFLLLDRLKAPAALTPIECFSLMIAALAHDMDHPGVNNAFLVNVRDSLALAYNDASVLENRHVACLYSLVTQNPDLDVFKHLDAATWKEVRRIIIAAILHTDMTQHFPMVSKLEVFLELKAADIQAAHTTQRKILRGQSNINTTDGTTNPSLLSSDSFVAMSAAAAAYAGADQTLSSVFATNEERTLLLCTILHTADISNPARPASIAEKWSDKVLAEFFAQGDQERQNGAPISPLCDRTTTSRPGSQINFIEFVVAPLFSLVARIFPDVGELMENVNSGRRFWQEELIREMQSDTTKTEEERKIELDKANGRLQTFMDKYSDALQLVLKRKRDLRKRLSTLRANSLFSPVAGDSNLFSNNSNNAHSFPLQLMTLHSTRTSAASSSSGNLNSPSLPNHPASPVAGNSYHRPSQSSATPNVDMTKAVAASLISTRRLSSSGRVGSQQIPPSQISKCDSNLSVYQDEADSNV